MNLALSRQAIADALNAVAGLRITAQPRTQAKGLDGWVTVGRLEPSTFTSCLTTFVAVVLLSPDQLAAEQLVEQLAIPVVNAITSTLNAADVAVEPTVLSVGNTAAPMYALTVSLALEVD